MKQKAWRRKTWSTHRPGRCGRWWHAATLSPDPCHSLSVPRFEPCSPSPSPSLFHKHTMKRVSFSTLTKQHRPSVLSLCLLFSHRNCYKKPHLETPSYVGHTLNHTHMRGHSLKHSSLGLLRDATFKKNTNQLGLFFRRPPFLSDQSVYYPIKFNIS